MAKFSFYSNENFAFNMVKILRALGHKVITSYDAGQANQAIPDNEVLKKKGLSQPNFVIGEYFR